MKDVLPPMCYYLQKPETGALVVEPEDMDRLLWAAWEPVYIAHMGVDEY